MWISYENYYSFYFTFINSNRRNYLESMQPIYESAVGIETRDLTFFNKTIVL